MPYSFFIKIISIMVGSFLIGSCTSTSTPSNEQKQVPMPSSLFENCQQLVVVRSPSDTLITGTLQKYERVEGAWKKIEATHPVTLGKTGLAWGYGEHKTQKGQHKKEGDGKSPAGIFTFGEAFGYAKEIDAPKFKLPYVHVSKVTQCIEDGTSKHYNTIIDGHKIAQDWTSTDFMRRKDDLYKWGVFVNHNVPAKAQQGSCIFFHLWRASNKPTLGCTGMTEENMLALLHWLDPAQHPMLVQLTEHDYQRFQQEYDLPSK